MMVFRIDEKLSNADWTKRTWDILDVGSAEQLRARIESSGMTVAQFKRLPVYQHAMAKKDPEWIVDL